MSLVSIINIQRGCHLYYNIIIAVDNKKKFFVSIISMKRAYKSNPVFEIKQATKAGHWTPEEHLAFIKGTFYTHNRIAVTWKELERYKRISPNP